jgi:cobalt transporter subunit CbtA
MIRALVLSAATAGLAGGLVAAAYQALVATPLILEAEVFEHAAEIAGAAAGQAAGEAAIHVAEGADFGRNILTSLATIVLATGGALILLGLMVLDGDRITAKRALLWGAGAFVALALAPAVGLPPELPGMPAGDLAGRQIWWLATVVATAFGLWLIFSRGSPTTIVFGLVVIVLPHFIGAPQPVSHDSDVPAGLAAQFAAASLAGSLILWLLVSSIAGAAFQRWGPSET